MRYFIDLEMIESGPGRPIHPLSLGVVAEDGRELYVEWLDPPTWLSNDWVREHVIPKLRHASGGCGCEQAPGRRLARAPGCPAAHNAVIKERLLDFIGADAAPVFWGAWSGYDWVVFAQIFGAMADLPKGFPYYCMDVAQWAAQAGLSLPSTEWDGEHDALSDARQASHFHDWLVRQTSIEGQLERFYKGPLYKELMEGLCKSIEEGRDG